MCFSVRLHKENPLLSTTEMQGVTHAERRPSCGRRSRYSIIIQFLAVIGDRVSSLRQLLQNTKHDINARKNQTNHYSVSSELALYIRLDRL